MKRRNSVISVGMVSIVLIFVLLSMLTFSVLSLVSAEADLRLSRKSADRTSAFYAAENSANDVLLEAENAAAAASSSGAFLSDEMFAEEVGGRLDPAYGVRVAGDTLCYEVPFDEEQVLEVTLKLSETATEAGRHCRVEVWRVVSKHDWEAGSVGELFDPDDLLFGEE